MTLQSPGVRGGFTAVEMAITLAITIVLTSISSPSVISAIKRGQVNGAANAILETHRDAQILAQRDTEPGTVYGVEIVRDGGITRSSITERRGGSLRELVDGSGAVVGRRVINPNVMVYAGSVGTQVTRLAWEFEPGTGAVLQAGGSARTAIGLPSAASLAAKFGVSDITGQRGVAIRIFPEGLSDAHAH